MEMIRALRRLLVATVVASMVPITAPAATLPDPTRPPTARDDAAQSVPLRDLRLDSILLSPHRRVAVIEGVAMQEGDNHNGIRVRRIDRNGVEIIDQGRIRVLYPQALPQVRENP